MEKISGYYSLKVISLWITNREITLPKLQRGFVWKPKQIEALWDSILRGYPIGALMTTDKKELLDGQQRCTSIALGFINPFEKQDIKSFLSLKNYFPNIWIDLKPSKKTQTQQFVIRVVNKSHPWGYQLQDNSKSLPMSDRRNAIEFFKLKQPDAAQYIDFLQENINPWDAFFPIPLSFLLSASIENEEKFISELKDKIQLLKIKTKYSGNQEVNFNDLNDNDLKSFFKAAKKANELILPEITVTSELLIEDSSSDKESEQANDPTLFVRLNSSGTAISGEELIYSIYKSMFPKSKETVENIAADYLSPARVINLVSRIIEVEVKKSQNLPKPFNPNKFRIELKNIDFKEKLNLFIEGKKPKELFQRAIDILKNGNNDFPPAILKQFVTSNINLFLVLLLYIKKQGNSLDLDVASIYVHILWFNKDKNKTIESLFRKLLNENKTWKEAADELETEKLLLSLLEPTRVTEILEYCSENLKPWDKEFENLKNTFSDYAEFFDNGTWKEFVVKIRDNKSMLLYAQREYLQTKFKEYNQFENLDDTNRPWDWDHIYPESWVKNLKQISNFVKNWFNTNGNFRALSYDDNRSENNHFSPKKRFEKDQNIKDSFVSESNLKYWKNLQVKGIKHGDNENIKIFLHAVTGRTTDIYKEWYNTYYNKHSSLNSNI